MSKSKDGYNSTLNMSDSKLLLNSYDMKDSYMKTSAYQTMTIQTVNQLKKEIR